MDILAHFSAPTGAGSGTVGQRVAGHRLTFAQHDRFFLAADKAGMRQAQGFGDPPPTSTIPWALQNEGNLTRRAGPDGQIPDRRDSRVRRLGAEPERKRHGPDRDPV